MRGYNAKETPDVAFEYWGIYETTNNFNLASLYHIDRLRTDCHNRLCKHYRLTKEKSRKVTDNLDKFEHAPEMHFALKELAAEDNDNKIGVKNET